jgi:tetratricopeptide (TPR) repeat protein
VKRLALSLLLLSLPLSARAGPEDGIAHLLAGAAHFREGRFAKALVEFRVAERGGAGGEAKWYVAACLVKLGRQEEALEVFDRAQATAPEARDALLTYYQALGCHEARLYLCADALLAEVGQAGGPQLSAQAAAMRASIARMLAVEPSRTAIDWYLAQAAKAQAAGREALARLYRSEAAGLAARRADRYREHETRVVSVAAGTEGAP